MGEKQDEALVRHGASPVRTHVELLPKISWTHVWGTMKWEKGVEGLEMRNKEKDKNKDKSYENK